MPAFHADQGDPVGQHVFQFLDEFEQVIGAVHLVHGAGFGVTDDHGRAVDAPGDFAFLAYQCFGFVLGQQVGVIQPGGFLEHVFGKGAVVKAGGRDGGDMMKTAGLNFFSQFQRLPRAFDVGVALGVFIGGQVINGGQMEKVIDLSVQIILVTLAHAQQFFVDVAMNGDQPVGIHTKPIAQGIQLVLGAAADQGKNAGIVAFQQTANQKTADKPGGTGNEIVHCFPLVLPCCLLGQAGYVVALSDHAP